MKSHPDILHLEACQKIKSKLCFHRLPELFINFQNSSESVFQKVLRIFFFFPLKGKGGNMLRLKLPHVSVQTMTTPRKRKRAHARAWGPHRIMGGLRKRYH